MRLLLAALAVVTACGPTIEGAAGGAAPSTARRATPEPTLRAKIGTPVTFSDGLRLSVIRVDEQKPTGGFLESTPHPGYRFVAVFIRAENASPQTVSIDDYDFTLQDGQGVRHRRELFAPDRPDVLREGNVVPGAVLAGTLTFEAPAGDAKLELIFDKSGYRTATFELY